MIYNTADTITSAYRIYSPTQEQSQDKIDKEKRRRKII